MRYIISSKIPDERTVYVRMYAQVQQKATTLLADIYKNTYGEFCENEYGII